MQFPSSFPFDTLFSQLLFLFNLQFKSQKVNCYFLFASISFLLLKLRILVNLFDVTSFTLEFKVTFHLLFLQFYVSCLTHSKQQVLHFFNSRIKSLTFSLFVKKCYEEPILWYFVDFASKSEHSFLWQTNAFTRHIFLGN